MESRKEKSPKSNCWTRQEKKDEGKITYKD